MGKRSLALRALALALIALLAACGALAEPEETRERFMIGQMRVLYMDHPESIHWLQVLYDATNDVLRVNPADFVGQIDDYSYHTNAHGGTARMVQREFEFDGGSHFLVMRLGDTACEYNMPAPALLREGELWVPANEFFRLIGGHLMRMAMDDDETDWDPRLDFVLVDGYGPNIPDLLHTLFKRENGIGWMFTYQRDFGLTDDQVVNKAGLAAFASNAYSVLTGDLNVIFALCTENFSSAANALSQLGSDLFGGEPMVFASEYEKMYYRQFLDAMVNPSKQQAQDYTENAQDVVHGVGSVVEISGNIMKDMALPNWGAGIWSSVPTGLSSLAPKLVHEYVDDQLQLLNRMYESIDPAVTGVGLGLDLLEAGIVTANLTNQLLNQDERMLRAVRLFIDTSQYGHRMDEVSRKSLEKAFGEVESEAGHFAGELTREMINIFALDVPAALGQTTLGTVAFVTTMTDLGWKGVRTIAEKIRPSLLASEDEPAAFQLSIYGMMYEADAWRALAEYYETYVLGNDFTQQDYVRECGLLALNYLKSCLVTTEAAVLAYASAPDIQSQSAYQAAIAKASELAAMIRQLVDALNASEKDVYVGLGMPFHRQDTAAVDAPELELYPLVLFDVPVAFAYDPFAPDAGTVTLVMLDEKQRVVCDVAEDGEAWMTLTDAGVGFRPAPASGAVVTRLRALRLSGSRLLVEWIACGGDTGGAAADCRYTVVALDVVAGIRPLLTGRCRASAAGQAENAAFWVDGASCDARAVADAFAEYGVSFVSDAVNTGRGARCAFPSAVAEDAEVLLILDSAAPSPLPPLIEELLLARGVSGEETEE